MKGRGNFYLSEYSTGKNLGYEYLGVYWSVAKTELTNSPRVFTLYNEDGMMQVK